MSIDNRNENVWFGANSMGKFLFLLVLIPIVIVAGKAIVHSYARWCIDATLQDSGFKVIYYEEIATLPENKLRDFVGTRLGWHNISEITCLYGNGIDDEKLKLVESAPYIFALELIDSDITSIETLQEMEYLQHLAIDSISLKSLEPLSQMSLTSLCLINTGEIDYSQLSAAESLETLELENMKFSDFSILANLEHLYHLIIQEGIIDDVDSIAKLKNLTMLHLKDCECNGSVDFSILASVTGLRSLHIENSEISNELKLCEWSKFENLAELTIVDSKLETLPTLKDSSVRKLKIDLPSIIDFDFLRESELTYLHIRNLAINDSDVDLICGLSNLDCLILENVTVSKSSKTAIDSLQSDTVYVYWHD